MVIIMTEINVNDTCCKNNSMKKSLLSMYILIISSKIFSPLFLFQTSRNHCDFSRTSINSIIPPTSILVKLLGLRLCQHSSFIDTHAMSVAHVVTLEADAKANGTFKKSMFIPLEEIDRAKAENDIKGFLKLIINKKGCLPVPIYLKFLNLRHFQI